MAFCPMGHPVHRDRSVPYLGPISLQALGPSANHLRRHQPPIGGPERWQTSAVFLNQLPVVNQSSGRDASGTLIFGSAPSGYALWANTGLGWFYQHAAPLTFG